MQKNFSECPWGVWKSQLPEKRKVELLLYPKEKVVFCLLFSFAFQLKPEKAGVQFGSWSQNAKQRRLPWGFFLSADIPDALQEGSENFDNWKPQKGEF